MSDELSTSSVRAISRIDAVPTILEVVCKTTGMGFAAVARVTEDRWIACGVRDDIAFGLEPGGELKVETTICHDIRENRQPVVIDDVARDPVFSMHHTPQMYGLQSYISMPIILPDGTFFGTLCAIDRVPRTLSTQSTISMFRLFADLIALHLDANQRVLDSEDRLRTEQENTALREEFIAVLGHDLRNPLASIEAGAKILQRSPLDDKSRSILKLMQASVSRMSGLIDDVLDFARGRLGSGLLVENMQVVPVRPMIEQVISELASTHPDRIIRADISAVSVRCDPARIGQLLSNLLANALTHGSEDGEIYVGARVENGRFELTVANPGDPIPGEIAEHLFKPFVRASANSSHQGLGLGLYIASEIARAHCGELTVASSAEETRFTLTFDACLP
ncbi:MULTISPECIES: GAF domain-containing sensor histidine kinase [Rhizobium]|uniref:histidine kinase n=1 Tax=Rhizobium rhododendri TaxID=2506430 RepID=A0ABY8IFK1_9HYPH|nr:MULTISPECIES: HAMP domain-containing sensor histidine kinase [Rhizobium]MBZ5759201.1 HAMP domain-containing histidine kinase [Rhizobium sp. VS19-DR96]MBZ5763968.1 HAMP domain-containing histidine kinase [Rhizobium sp. VS19-DR129.2]MBZ5771512.1 HAMP domain-containing histidine kinase [Rhizobium sp. VS19-DRK62.2]MBZ5783801.1 HAMP domain-containing histidine kinase [Rhizobium sp. VS19-DR121]MBZ5801525.1 HAMP domain-containing histidine kinase [Rhizobium sp. VS19-DR181]